MKPPSPKHRRADAPGVKLRPKLTGIRKAKNAPGTTRHVKPALGSQPRGLSGKVGGKR